MSPLQVLSKSTWHWGQGERRMSQGRLLWSVFSTTEVHSYSEGGCHQNSTPGRRAGSLSTWHKLGFSGTTGPGEFSSACWMSCLACEKIWDGLEGEKERDADIKTQSWSSNLSIHPSHLSLSIYLASLCRLVNTPWGTFSMRLWSMFKVLTLVRRPIVSQGTWSRLL